MNAPLRRLAWVIFAMFTSLLMMTSWTSVVKSKELNADKRNSRVFMEQIGRERSPIVTGDNGNTVLAKSEPSNDVYKFQRQYPLSNQYAHVVGYMPIQMQPTGIESAEAASLVGTSDKMFYRRFTDVLTGKSPKGATVELTINPQAQQAAWDALGDQRGAVVAIEPKTGNILAMVSKPSYDPNPLAAHDPKAALAAFQSLDKDPDKPLQNRSTDRHYPPGSVFKVVMSAMALESGKYRPDSQVPGPAQLDLPGTKKTINNSHGACGAGGMVSLQDALRVSCNTTFAAMALEYGNQAIVDQAAKFGFDQPLSTPLRVSKSKVPSQADKAQLAMMGIGQFEVQTTPMQMAMVASAVANKGSLMKPQLIKDIRASDFTIISRSSPEVMSQAISPQTATMLTQMMVSVVESGTGKAAQIDGVEVAGKTGTAQNAPDAPPHAWFMCFGPTQDAKVAVAVVVEQGGTAGDEASGGKTAAPIAKKVIEAVIGR